MTNFKSNLKKILSLVLAIVMLIGVVPAVFKFNADVKADTTETSTDTGAAQESGESDHIHYYAAEARNVDGERVIKYYCAGCDEISYTFDADSNGCPVIYADSLSGSDMNMGNTDETPVQTMSRAFEILANWKMGGTVVLIRGFKNGNYTTDAEKLPDVGGTVTITSDTTFLAEGGKNYREGEYRASFLANEAIYFNNDVVFDNVVFTTRSANTAFYMKGNDFTVNDNCVAYGYSTTAAVNTSTRRLDYLETKAPTAYISIITGDYSGNIVDDDNDVIDGRIDIGTQTIDIRSGIFENIQVGNRTATGLETKEDQALFGQLYINIGENATVTMVNTITQYSLVRPFITVPNGKFEVFNAQTESSAMGVAICIGNELTHTSDGNGGYSVSDSGYTYETAEHVTVVDNETLAELSTAAKIEVDEGGEENKVLVRVTATASADDITLLKGENVKEFGFLFKAGKLGDAINYFAEGNQEGALAYDGTGKSVAYVFDDPDYQNYFFGTDEEGNEVLYFNGILEYDEKDGDSILYGYESFVAYPYVLIGDQDYVTVGSGTAFTLAELANSMLGGDDDAVANQILSNLAAPAELDEYYYAEGDPNVPAGAIAHFNPVLLPDDFDIAASGTLENTDCTGLTKFVTSGSATAKLLSDEDATEYVRFTNTGAATTYRSFTIYLDDTVFTEGGMYYFTLTYRLNDGFTCTDTNNRAFFVRPSNGSAYDGVAITQTYNTDNNDFGWKTTTFAVKKELSSAPTHFRFYLYTGTDDFIDIKSLAIYNEEPPAVIFLRSTGNDSNDGYTPDKAKATLSAAYEALADNGGVIVVCDAITQGSFQPSKTGAITITSRYGDKHYTNSASLTLTGNYVSQSDLTFENIKLISGAEDKGFIATGYNFTIGENVVCELADGITTYLDIFLGLNNSTSQIPASRGSTLTINSGIWDYVYGGMKYAAGSFAGDTNIIINGGTFNSKFAASSVRGTIGGNMNLTINGGTFNEIVTLADAASVVNGNVNVTITGGVFNKTIYAANGAGKIDGDVNLTVSGGDFSAIPDGLNITSFSNEKGVIGGNYNVVVTGGTYCDGFEFRAATDAGNDVVGKSTLDVSALSVSDAEALISSSSGFDVTVSSATTVVAAGGTFNYSGNVPASLKTILGSDYNVVPYGNTTTTYIIPSDSDYVTSITDVSLLSFANSNNYTNTLNKAAATGGELYVALHTDSFEAIVDWDTIDGGEDGFIIEYKSALESFGNAVLDENPNATIVLISPYYRVDSELATANALTMANAMQEVATDKGWQYIDVYNPGKLMYEKELLHFQEWTGADAWKTGWKLSPVGYEFIAEIIAEQLFDITSEDIVNNESTTITVLDADSDGKADEEFHTDDTQFSAAPFNYCPSIIELNGKRYIWYCTNSSSSLLSSGITDSIGYIEGTVADGSVTYTNAQVVQSPASGYADDGGNNCDPSVIKGTFLYNNGTYEYLMAYLGAASGQGGYNNWIGFSVSNDGINWTKVSTTALVTHEEGKWGVGQPSLVSVDGGSKVLLFYTSDTTEEGTVTKVSVCDFSTGVTADNIGTPVTVGEGGLETLKAAFAADVLRNADFMLDVANGIMWAVSDCNPNPEGSVICTDVRVTCFKLPNWDGNVSTYDWANFDWANVEWEMVAQIGENDTGYARNHNAGFVRDQHGYAVDSNNLTVYFATATIGDNSASDLSEYIIRKAEVAVSYN